MNTDPLMHGSIVCGECSEASWPTDGVWLTDELLLISYDDTHKPRCSHRKHPFLVLMNMASDDTLVPFVPRPRRCAGFTGGGYPCKHFATKGSRYCSQHVTQAAP